MNPLVRILLSLLILAFVAGCAGHKNLVSSTALTLRSIDIGQIDFQPDSGRLLYGGRYVPETKFLQNSAGNILEDDDDLYVLYEEGYGTPNKMHYYAYGIKTKHIKKLRANGRDISVRKLAELNNMKALNMIEPQRRSKCLEMTDKSDTLGSAHCWDNPLFPARHGISKKHQYYFTSENRVNGENSETFTIEYIDYSKFGVKTNYIEDIVNAIEDRKKVLFLRDENTFNGYLMAFNLSSDFSDLENAQSLAKSSSQRLRLSNAWKKAGEPDERLSLEKITDAQTTLKYGGYYKMAIDGKYGPGSIKALKEFQAEYDMPVNGKLDPRSMRQLGAFKREWDKQNEWKTIRESSLSNTISGKTLVATHSTFCKDKKSVVPCTKIAVLSEKDSAEQVAGQNKATVIDHSLKQIRQEAWGIGASSNGISSAFHLGLMEIHRKSGGFQLWGRTNRIGKRVAINSKRNTLKIELDGYSQKYLIVDIEDNGANYIAKANRRNYKAINNRDKLASPNANLKKEARKTVIEVSKTGTSYNDFDKYNVSCRKKSNNEVIWFNTKRRYWENKSIGFIPTLYGEKNMMVGEVATYICSR